MLVINNREESCHVRPAYTKIDTKWYEKNISIDVLNASIVPILQWGFFLFYLYIVIVVSVVVLVFVFLYCYCYFTPRTTKLLRGILVSLRPYVRPSVRPSRLPCPLYNIYSSRWILSILATNDPYHERVCRKQWPLTLTYIFKVIRPWPRKTCPLCSVYSSRWILFIFGTNDHYY